MQPQTSGSKKKDRKDRDREKAKRNPANQPNAPMVIIPKLFLERLEKVEIFIFGF